ncbi:MAG: VOC family protein [Proteobacteria bacterium]|nr:VOC family protein [Pseudomonadota bacterium]
MTEHLGRLIDHVHLKTRNLDAAARFYAAIFEALGIPCERGEGDFHADEFYLSQGEPTGELHLAFQARDRGAVENAWRAAVAAGGRDNGGPGERDYHPGYYAAFVLDPDGNNVEAVFHGPARRSAESVTVER